jgi:hypothetical protein
MDPMDRGSLMTPPAGEEMTTAREGWNQSFDKLVDVLAAEKRWRPG